MDALETTVTFLGQPSGAPSQRETVAVGLVALAWLVGPGKDQPGPLSSVTVVTASLGFSLLICGSPRPGLSTLLFLEPL